MARRRFFVPAFRNGQAELTGEEAHHLTRVLRVEAGQRYEVSDNSAAWLAEVAEARKSRVLFRLLEPVPARPLPVAVALYCSLIKFDRFEWILEKGTEAGVARFVPVIAARSERGLDQAAARRRERWERILSEASQQSRRDRLPELAPEPLRLAAALADPPPAVARLLLDEDRGAPPLLAQLGAAAASEVALLLGPEGGWTESEREQALAAGWRAATLGPLILRAETAALAAAAVAMAHACTTPTEK